jgi:hypothetical protein
MRIHYALKVPLIRPNIQGENFARLAFHQHFHGPATDFTVRGELLRSYAGVQDQLERLATERTLHCFRHLHGCKIVRLTFQRKWARRGVSDLWFHFPLEIGGGRG